MATVKAFAWETLTRLVEQSDMPHKEEAVDVLRNVPETTYDSRGVLTDSRRKHLMELQYGRTWRYMEKHFFPGKRSRAFERSSVSGAHMCFRPNNRDCSVVRLFSGKRPRSFGRLGGKAAAATRPFFIPPHTKKRSFCNQNPVFLRHPNGPSPYQASVSPISQQSSHLIS